MFVRSTGPVVFSDSSDSDDDDYEQTADDGSDENEGIKSFVDSNSPEQPSKKKKKLV